MNNYAKLLLSVGVAGGLFLLLKNKISSLTNTWKYLIITPKLNGGIKSVKINLSGITLPVAIDFANRSDETFTVQLNALDVYLNNKLVSQSAPSSQEVSVPGNSTKTLTGLNFTISLTSLVSLVGDVIKTILAEGSLSSKFANFISQLKLDGMVTLNRTINYTFNCAIGESTQAGINSTKSSKVAGLGLVAASERKIKPMSDYINLIPAKSELRYSDLIVIPNGSVEDTVHFMHKVALKYKSDTELLAKSLECDKIKDTVENIYWFVYKYIQYVPDSTFTEQVRRPLRTLWDRKGDCDCYSVLIGSILHNLNIPFKFRIAAYNGRENYQHVYVVVPSSTGELVCDPVVDRPLYQKQPSKFKDFNS